MSGLPAFVLHRLSQVPLTGRSLPEVLQELAGLTEEALPGADAVSVTLLRADRGHTAAYTAKVALELDETQYAVGHGPCLDAARSGTTLVISDMATEDRWPDYTPRAVEAGIASSVSAPLPLQSGLAGAINIYGSQVDAFDSAVARAREFAACMAVACANAESYHSAVQEAQQMREAMASRAVIEQAKGVIMAQNRCSPDRAFEILRSASMGRNVKLRDLAWQIVETMNGDVPTQ